MRKRHIHKWKYQINVKKKIIVLVVLGVSLFVGLGYALIESNLGFFGTLEFGTIDNTLYDALRREVNKGYALKYTNGHQDSMDASKSTEDIYYFNANTAAKGTAILNKNNVVFAGRCWQMIRTTDTGGVKLLYNGDPTVTDVGGVKNYDCSDTRPYHIGNNATTLNLMGTRVYGKGYISSVSGTTTTHTLTDTETITVDRSNIAEKIEYIKNNYPYSCNNSSGTCQNDGLRKVIGGQASDIETYAYKSTYNDNIGTSAFNGSHKSPAYVGYMYGDTYIYDYFEDLKKQTFTAKQNLYSTTITLGTSYYYADSIDWNTITANKYTLIDPIQITSETDYNSLAGKYVISNGTTGSSVSYIIGVYHDNVVYIKSLSNGNNDVSMIFADDLTATGELDNPTAPVTLSEFFKNHEDYREKYTCGDLSVSCANPRFITSTTAMPTNYTYMAGSITISKTRNGLELTTPETITYGKWYKEYDTTYKDYLYTCGNTSTTCTESNLRYVFTKYTTGYAYAINHYFGNSVVYEDNKYKLKDTVDLEAALDLDAISTHHYTCITPGEKECEQVAYIQYYIANIDKTFGARMYYLLINDPNVINIQSALDAMYNKNTTNSTIKTFIDSWYQKNLLDTIYEPKIDDVIYCNDRSLPTIGDYTFEKTRWNANGGYTNERLYFNDTSYGNPSLSCSNNTDRFSVSNSAARLTYPVGLMTYAEMNLIGSNSARKTRQMYWLGSPNFLNDENSLGQYVGEDGSFIVNWSAYSVSKVLGVRPSISLVQGTRYYRGTGSMTNPYVVDSPVYISRWYDTQLSGTNVTTSSATTTISTIGSTANGKAMNKIEYYTTCSSGTGTGSKNNPQTADIMNNNSATITFNACPGATLYYRINDVDNNYSDGWIKVENIAQYVLYSQIYNNMIFAGGVASNDETNLTYWIDNPNYENIAHRLIAMSYYDENSEATVEALDTTTLVERAYPTFLGRAADESKNTWISKLDNGEETIESFFLSFINSSEAKNIRSAWGLDSSEYHP